MIKLLLFCGLFFSHIQAFDKVVIWGHKKNSHTHFYIHNAFNKAFKHLGYDVYWFDDEDVIEDFDFENSLFLVEGQVDRKIPLRNDCKYILHNCNNSKYQHLDQKNWMRLQVYTDDVLDWPSAKQVEPFVYFDIEAKTLFMPWATDLLPHEIDAQKDKIRNRTIQNKIYWIGTIGEGEFGNIHEITPFVKAAEESGIEFIKLHPGQATVEENAELISISYLAPAILGDWQVKKGYIPCRIFKNISYGAMGVTNSVRVFELFQRRIVYNPDTYQLFFDAKERLKKYTLTKTYRMMDFVKKNHTYLNRIARILEFLELIEKNY